jgi:hypothetical protein
MKRSFHHAALQAAEFPHMLRAMEAKASVFIPFLGSIGAAELVIILVVLFLLALPIALVLILVKLLSKPAPPALPGQPNPRENPPALGKSHSEDPTPEAKRKATHEQI